MFMFPWKNTRCYLKNRHASFTGESRYRLRVPATISHIRVVTVYPCSFGLNLKHRCDSTHVHVHRVSKRRCMRQHKLQFILEQASGIWISFIQQRCCSHLLFIWIDTEANAQLVMKSINLVWVVLKGIFA